ncbi:M24 family metallopeptidase [Tomitella fengzijianii]|uniref:Aminopeptidase P family protein n=1 Tax=Tomitella fengzijianii TaxID=2597660 RepID=A0A516X2V2_9ACTN|nr:Xaa-Pro peptidase family protein [Tomitella fengzijianii]QDQ97370.1 aminopeptidase P family protein [Tomitella fengzijianii]
MTDSAPQPATRFAAATYADRLARAARLAADAGLDALVIGTGPDLQYLTGSRAHSFERLTAIVVPASGAPATVVVPRLELASLRDSAIAELGLRVLDWVDGVDPHGLVTDIVAEAMGDGTGAPAIAVDPALPALHVVPLAGRIGAPARLATPVLRELRMIKDAEEVEALRRAGAAIDRVHARMGEWLKAGRTERQAAEDIAAAIVEEGHTEPEFIIVGSGPHGADPHHEVSDRVLAAGDVVVIDIGGPVEPGYNSDSTRTYCIGEPDPEIARRYALLEAAQEAARRQARPGVTAESVDAAARDELARHGLADAFVHRTGHGIGLSVHEEPYIVAGNAELLRPGMAFSIEPGIYFQGEWGARIEDIVVVTDDGCEPLNTRPRALGILSAH